MTAAIVPISSNARQCWVDGSEKTIPAPILRTFLNRVGNDPVLSPRISRQIEQIHPIVSSYEGSPFPLQDPIFRLFCKTLQTHYHLRIEEHDFFSFFQDAILASDKTTLDSFSSIFQELAQLSIEDRQQVCGWHLQLLSDIFGTDKERETLLTIIRLGHDRNAICSLAHKIFSQISSARTENRMTDSVIHILKAIEDLPGEEREEIVELTARSLDGVSRGSIVTRTKELFTLILSIPLAERLEIFSLATSLTDSLNPLHSFAKALYLQAIGKALIVIPHAERADFIRILSPIIQLISFESVPSFLDCLTKAPYEKRHQLILDVQAIHCSADPLPLLETIQNIPQPSREKIIRLASSCKSFCHTNFMMKQVIDFLLSAQEENLEALVELLRENLCRLPLACYHFRQLFLCLLPYFPPDPVLLTVALPLPINPSILTEFELLKNILLRQPLLIKAVHEQIVDTLHRILLDPIRTLVFVQPILHHSHCFLIHDTPLDPYLFAANDAARNRSDPQKPYAVYTKAKELSETPTPSVKRPRQRYGRNLYVLLPGRELPICQKPIPLRALPQDIDRHTIAKLFATFKNRIQTSSERQHLLSHIQDTTSFSFASHKANLTGCSYLRSLFPSSDEPHISFHGAYYVAIIKHLLDLSDDISGEDLLSPREKRLLEISCWIRNCPARRAEALSLLYGSLPIAYQYTPATQDSPEVLHVKSFLTNTIQKVFLEILSSDDSYLRKLTKVKGNQEIAQLTHQSVFVKNCLASHIGLQHSLSFDLSTETLYPALLEQTLPSMLSLFYKHISLNMLTTPLLEAVNTTNVAEHDEWYRRCMKVLDPIDAEELDKVWDLSDDGSTFSLTHYGAMELWRKAGFFSKEKLPWWHF